VRSATGHRCSFQFLGLALLALLLGCSATPAADTTTEDELQAAFIEEAASRQSDWAGQLQVCAAHNGVGPERSLAYLNALAAQSNGSTFAPPSSDDAIRAQLGRVGSGLIASLQDQSLVRTIDRSAAGLTEEELRIIEVGPIDDPTADESFAAGCVSWATRTVEDSDEFAPGVDREREYGEFIDEYLEGNIEIAELDRDWARCMAEKGFGGFERRGDHIQVIIELRQDLIASQADYDGALQRDIDMSLANFDCQIEIDADSRTQAVYDEAAEEFSSND